MKKFTILFVVLAVCASVSAQEVKKQKEVGLSFYNLDQFGLSYKKGNNKVLWRYNLLFVNGAQSETEVVADSIKTSNSSLGFGLKFGREWRKVLVPNLELRYGTDLFYSFHKTKRDRENSDNYLGSEFSESSRNSYGFNLVLGLNYVINDALVIGVEVLPYLSYNKTTSIDRVNSDSTIEDREIRFSTFSYGLNTNSVMLSLAYRF